MVHKEIPAADVTAFALKLRRASNRATPQLLPLIDTIAPLAKARPDAPAPADLLALARRALRAAAPIARSLDAPPPLPLHPPVSLAGLAARLALAERQDEIFRRRHSAPGSRVEAITWHVEERLLAVAARTNPKVDTGLPGR